MGPLLLALGDETAERALDCEGEKGVEGFWGDAAAEETLETFGCCCNGVVGPEEDEVAPMDPLGERADWAPDVEFVVCGSCCCCGCW
jgi:hypothetical protein